MIHGEQFPAIRIDTVSAGHTFTVQKDETVIIWMRLGVLTVDVKGDFGDGTIFLLGNDFLILGLELTGRLTIAHENSPIIILTIKKDLLRGMIAERQFSPPPDGHVSDALKVLDYVSNIYHYPDTRALITCMEFLINDFQDGEYPGCEPILITDLLRLLWYIRKLNPNSFAPLSTAKTAQEIAWIMKYIRSNYQTASLKEAAEILHYNPDYLSVLIQKVASRSFSNLLTTRRVIVSRTYLIHSAYSMKDIATAIGFKSYSGFYRAFHNYYGMSPYEYRKLHQSIVVAEPPTETVHPGSKT